MQIVAIIISLTLTAIAVPYVALAVRKMLSVIRTGGPAVGRTDQPVARTVTMLKETFLHTRMLQWTYVGLMHWFVYLAFVVLASAVLAGYFQLFDPSFVLPIIGHFFLFEWVSEGIGLLGTIGIIALIIVRQKNHPRSLGRKSRFFGSRFWQAYFVEAFVLLESAAILFIRGAEYRLLLLEGSEYGNRFHFPIAGYVGDLLFSGLGEQGLENAIFAIAMIKVSLAMIWLMIIASNLTMGIAWHRFTAFFNIWFKRESDGSTALGGLEPIRINGKALDMEALEDLEEEDFETLGVGKVEDFSWKGILDFTTCTECGRCQSQCPAWNTEKPLSPKLLVMGLREHAYAKAPLLDADPETLTDEQKRELERPLIGDEDLFGVIDPDVLWSCTNCGACVQQCPVDIEHVDHIDDMRRFQVLVESNFPTELNNIFKGLERKGNPWGMNPKHRMDWAKDLDFEVKQVGVDVESLDEVEWLFWVGCAGAFEDRAKKTTQAVAELLNTAGVDFAVLGDGETCTGDPARRAGNEIVFMQLAMENAEVLKETKAKKVVSTCAHCFNTLKNEYAEFGIELEVVHHTQLLNRLVREKKLTPVAPGAGAAEPAKTITYHDPCFLGRHNKVYEAPRELLEVIPGATFAEMPRNSEKSFCCGAGGARMWMEENLGSRININRTEEAIATGADQIAVGCPFCRVMLSDGLTAKQDSGEAREEVEVLDVAQMLLASVKREPALVGAAVEAEPNAADEANPDSISDTAEAGPPADTHTKPEEVAGTSDEVPKDDPAPTSQEADEEVAAEHDVPLADSGAAKEAADGGGVSTQASREELAPEAETPDAAPDEPASEKEPDEPASEKDSSAWDNVGAVNTDLLPDSPASSSSGDGAPTPDPEPEEGDVTETETEAVPASDDGPGSDDDADPQEASPAEEPAPAPAPAPETKPVEEDAREEESGEQPSASATPVADDGEIVAVEDAPTTDPTSPDSAPLSDANPSGADVSEAATALGRDDETDTEGGSAKG